MVTVELERAHIFCDFLKVDSNNKVIATEKYELVRADTDEGTGLYMETGDFNQHSLKIFNYNHVVDDTITKLFKAFPEHIKNEIINVSVRSDLDKFQNYDDIVSYSSNSSSVLIGFTLPLKFKQVTAEAGYKKDNVILPAAIEVYYAIDSEDNITNASIEFRAIDRDSFIIYNMDATPIDNFNDLAKFQYKPVDKACLNTEGGRIITDRSMCNAVDLFVSTPYDFIPYFISQKGNVTFKIENTVNDLVKYNASKNKELTYKITVTNTGNASSSDNVITTNVAKEVTVNEKGISDSGVYNKKDHTITWNVDLIDVGEVLSVTYEATAPADANGKELIGNSSIRSAQVTKDVYSNFTVVTLDKVIEVVKNPNTGTMLYVANTNVGISVDWLMSILLFFAVLLIVFRISFKKMRMKRYKDI